MNEDLRQPLSAVLAAVCALSTMAAAGGFTILFVFPIVQDLLAFLFANLTQGWQWLLLFVTIALVSGLGAFLVAPARMNEPKEGEQK